MKSGGLTGAKNLGELVSGRYQARTTSASASTASRPLTITTGSGRTKTVGTVRNDPNAAPGKSAAAGRSSNSHTATAVATARGNGANAATATSSGRGSSVKTP
jgi:hypothetical protein